MNRVSASQWSHMGDERRGEYAIFHVLGVSSCALLPTFPPVLWRAHRASEPQNINRTIQGECQMGMKGSASRGWTLAELLCAMTILGILVTLTVPSLAAAMARTERRSVVNDLFSDLALTRSEAIEAGHRVVMCKSPDHQQCAHDGSWQTGWMVFVDANNNAQHDVGERVLQVRHTVKARWRLTANGSMAKYVSYHPNGRSRQTNGGFQAGTFTVCDKTATVRDQVKVIINAAGRPRIETRPAEECE